MRRLVVASAILATLLMVPLGAAAATPSPSVPATDSDRATAALEYLLAAQKPDGTWPETAATGTGFPGVFYLTYHMYRNYFPLQALATYAR